MAIKNGSIHIIRLTINTSMRGISWVIAEQKKLIEGRAQTHPITDAIQRQ
jgi:hypothetical protein